MDPLEPHALLGVAKADLRRGRVEAGVDAALRPIGALYRNPMAHYVLGLGLLRMRQYLRAGQAVRVAVALNPNFERAHRFLARYALKAEQDLARSREHWAMVRRIRAERRARGRRHAEGSGLLDGVGLDGAAAGSDPDREQDQEQEHRRIPFDASPSTGRLVRKQVPDDPAACVTVVAGLPRSGTSLLMQMARRAGDGRRGGPEPAPAAPGRRLRLGRATAQE